MPDAAIRDYIRANRATYTRASIERTLRAAGHTEETIAAAWAAVEAEGAQAEGAQAPAATAPGGVAAMPGITAPAGGRAAPEWRSQSTMRLAMRTLAFWLALVGFLVVYIGLSTLLVFVTDAQTSWIAGLTIVGLPILALVAGIPLAIVERTRPIGLGLLGALLVMVGLLGLLATLAFIAVVIIFGICLVYLARGTTP